MEYNLRYLPYIEEKTTSDWGTVCIWEKIFNDNLIQKLQKMVFDNYSFTPGATGATEFGKVYTTETNNRQIAYLPPNDDTKWLYSMLFDLALKANHDKYHFDIDTITDQIHYVIYPENGGHLTWHQDVGAYSVNRRKIALTVQLSDPNSYEGGDFEIWTGGDNYETLTRNKGDIVAFPTFLMHRVTPITQGERHCLVFWAGGRPFR